MLSTLSGRRLMVLRFSTVFLLLSPPVMATDEVAGGASIYSISYLIQVLGALLLVFGCLFGLLFLLKKIQGAPASDRKSIRVLGSLKVGAREKILLISAHERHLLVGVAAGGVRTLHVFESGSELTGDPVGQFTDFSSLLGSATRRQGRE